MKVIKKILVFAFLALLATSAIHFSLAAELDAGLEHVEGTGLGQEDPRIIAARIIRVILGFLGIIALGLIIYAGFVMMTAQGSAEKIDKAKKILVGAVIGLVIVLSSFAIASFVLSRLLGATQPVDGGGGGGGGGFICDPACGDGQFCCYGSCQNSPCSAADSFRVKATVPKEGETTIRNVRVKIFFNKALDSTLVNAEILKDNLKVEKVATVNPDTKNETPVAPLVMDGTVAPSADWKEIVYTSSLACGDEKNTPSCLDAWGKYKVTVDGASGLKAAGGQGLSCIGNSCQFEFYTNNLIDSDAPQAGIIPAQICVDDGQLKPDANTIGAWGRDDFGISSIKFNQQKKNGVLTWVHTEPGNGRSYQMEEWKYDTQAMNVGDSYTFGMESADMADRKTSANYSSTVKPGHCCNGKKDSGEEDVDCGGPDCLSCVGGPCNLNEPNQCTLNGTSNCSDNLCSTYFCECKTDDCLCEVKPIVYSVDPKGGFCSNDKNKACSKNADCGAGNSCDRETPNGAAENFITITGKYFGTTPGQVVFLGNPNDTKDDKTATFPISVNPNCTKYWQDAQIIAVVPSGVIAGPIKVVSGSNKEDSTDDDRGPRLKNFVSNTLARAGLCSVSPDNGFFGDNFNLQGASFPAVSRGVYFGTETSSTTANNLKNWSNTSVDASVPNLAVGKSSIFIKGKDSISNSLFFSIKDNSANDPLIDYIDPNKGPVGQYITIYGKNFQSFETGKSFVKFYSPDDPQKLIEADIDFVKECSDRWWHNGYIIVKVPKAEKGDYKVIVTNREGKVSKPGDFTVTTGAPGPGLCALIPHNGPVGQAVSAYGDHFNNKQDAGRVSFYNNIDALVSGWADKKIDTSVPSGAVTGPFKVINSEGDLSNSLPFTVGSCSASSQCEGGEECCASGTYWAGICQKEGSCNAGKPQSCGYSWTFSTKPKNGPILTCGGYTNVKACQASGFCPNSPGLCQTSENVDMGKGCGDSYCNSTYPVCSGQCIYDAALNKCQVKNSVCDQTKTVAGITAECRTVNNKNVWQLNIQGGSCPTGSFMDLNQKCTLGSLTSPEECQLCGQGLSCQNSKCVVSSAVCPQGSTCQDNKCIKTSGVCECCCRVDKSAEDCCAGLTCEAGGCGTGAPDYGLCSGCKVTIGGQVNQEASDNACNCKGGSTRVCDLTDPSHPIGVCRDKGDVGSSCDSEPATPVCNADDNKCLDGLFCDTASCTCQPGGEIGDSCDGDVATAVCDPNNNMCNPGLTCSSTSCTCQSGGGPGETCEIEGVAACSEGVAACSADLACLDKANSDCRCCCVPGTKNESGLECIADKGPCDTNNRGLFCGCSSDTQCGDSQISGCSFDTCCRARPLTDSVAPDENASSVCRNTMVTATFDQPMDAGSFSEKLLLLGDYGAGSCPAGTDYIAIKKDYKGPWAVRTAERIINLLARVPLLNDILFSGNAYALSGNFCSVKGTVSGFITADDKSVINFSPLKVLDGNRKYYAIIKGDGNINDNISEGVLSFYGVGMSPEDSETFNGLGYQGKIWSFTTMSAQSENNGICAIEKVEVSPSSYLFKTVKNSSAEKDDNPLDASFDKIKDSDKVFAARALSKDGQVLASVQEYSWNWDWITSKPSAVNFAVVAGLSNDKRLARAQEGVSDDSSILTAKASISNGTSVEGAARAYVFVCENPWPSIGNDGLWQPWRDDTQGMNCLPNSGTCLNTNYELYYCRDAGGVGTADDLPAILSDDTIIRGTSDQQSVIKESYFLREKLPSISMLAVDDQQTGGKVYASWTPVPNAKGYKIYYGEASGSYNKYFDVGNTTSRIISSLTDNKKYYFAVTAYYATGAESSHSNEVTVAPTDKQGPAVPGGLKTEVADKEIKLTWTANNDDTVGYKIYYGTSSGVYGQALDTNKTDFKISDLSGGNTYYITVAAFDKNNNESAKATEIILTLP